MTLLRTEELKCPRTFPIFSSLSSPALQGNGWCSWATTPGRVSSPGDSTAHCPSRPSTSRTCTRWTTASCSTWTPPVRLHPSAPISAVSISLHLTRHPSLSPLVSAHLHLFQCRTLILKKKNLNAQHFKTDAIIHLFRALV